MATFKPFPAIRPAAEYAADALCPPYDVVDRNTAARYCSNPVNFMRVIRADALLPEDEAYSEKTYELSRANLDRFLADGIYSEDRVPRYYVYSETFRDRTQTGIAGCASIDEYNRGIIKKHEVTRTEKELDRIRHFAACDANTEPVFLTYRDNEQIRQLTAEITENSDPEYSAEDESGVLHRLWPVYDENTTKKLEELFRGVDYMYIADGHHRTASAVKVGHMKREEYGEYSGVEEFNRFMAVAFPESELRVLPYNRLISDLNGLTPEEFLDRLTETAAVTEVSGDELPGGRHVFSIYTGGKWYSAAFHGDITGGNDPVKSLDVYILQEYVLDPVLGVKDPRTDPRLSFSGGTGSIGEMKAAVDAGKAAAAFALCPVSIREIMNVADNGLIMPPKSTWFEPKLGSGWFVHRID